MFGEFGGRRSGVSRPAKKQQQKENHASV